ncbi:MAG: hypothetical protein AAF944_29135 [Bacteroidota bacterium]
MSNELINLGKFGSEKLILRYGCKLADSERKMKKDIQLLIEEMQNEHDRLEREMRDCVEMGFFQEAAVFQQSLFYTDQKLRTLKNIEYPNYDQINVLKRRIDRTNELKSKISPSAWLTHFEREAVRDKQELIEMEKLSAKPQLDSDELIKCLEALLADEIVYFCLEFDKGDAKIEVKQRGEDLQLHLKSIDGEPLEDFISFYGKSELRRIGFTVSEQAATLQLQAKPQEILTVVEILSRVTFDALGFYVGRGVIKY